MGLGLERSIPDSKVIWQVEKDPFCRSVLARHFPDAERHPDICTIENGALELVDIVAAGFPCQGASVAGSRGGLSDERTGLWWQLVRVLGFLHPRIVILENVPGLISVREGRDFQAVLWSLAQLGYDAEWSIVSAGECGAPHIRKRLFILAYASHSYSRSEPAFSIYGQMEKLPKHATILSHPGSACNDERKNIQLSGKKGKKSAETTHHFEANYSAENENEHDWTKTHESPFLGMDDGLSARVDRCRALGNAVVPQCMEWIGKRLLSLISVDYGKA